MHLDGVALDERDALVALVRLGLRGREELPVRVLSAGQKRRVLLARLLTRPAKLWVLDEAFNALDVAAVREFLTQQGLRVQATPERIEIVDTLPRNPAGKVLKREIVPPG